MQQLGATGPAERRSLRRIERLLPPLVTDIAGRGLGWLSPELAPMHVVVVEPHELVPLYPPPGGGGVTTAQVETAIASIFVGRGNSGAVVAAGTASLAANLYCTTYSVPNTATVRFVGYAIYAITSITIDAGGLLEYAAPATINASGATGGTGGTGGTVPYGAGPANGVNGGTGTGTVGTNASGSIHGAVTDGGGDGGAGVAGGGDGGDSLALTAAQGSSPMTIVDMLRGNNIPQTAVNRYQGGASGGAGGGDGAAGTGGGSGAGGGLIPMFCGGTITNNGTVRAPGGNGGTPVNSAGLAQGGGGGGQAGGIITTAQAYAGSGTWDVPGGAAGSGINGGANGVAGQAGTKLTYRVTLTGLVLVAL